MIQIAFVSGKGGTGKTVLTASCACLLPEKKVLIDADVDAANLSLLLDSVDLTSEEFMGMDGAFIDPDSCTGCGLCAEACQFDAILQSGDLYKVLPYRCEGCGTCTLVCPEDCITLKPMRTGTIHYATTGIGPLIYGSLLPGSGNSGLLVHRLRLEAGLRYPDVSLTLIDGPPGIGCPLISTITGIQVAVLVTEPSRSAFQDLMRLITLCRSFKIMMYLVVNRCDISLNITREILKVVDEEKILVIGMVPYDPIVVKATRMGIPVVDMEGKASQAIHQMVQKLLSELKIYGTSNR